METDKCFGVIFTLKVLSTNASNVSNILTEVHKANYLPKICYKNLLSSSQNDRLVNDIFKYFHSLFTLLEFRRWLLKHHPDKEKVHDPVSSFIISTYGNVLLNRENESYYVRLYNFIF